jgi:RHS repeat-associated protein
MPGRSWAAGTSYRYGFNGKENDNEVEGEGNHQDYGMRIYDPRVGRFLSVDPLTKSYPWYTPYQFAGNKPIWGTDLDGLEVRIYTETKGTGHTFLTVGRGDNLVLYTYGRYAGGNWYTAGTTGPGVLIKYTGAEATSYIKTELYQNEVKVFEVSGIKDHDVRTSMNDKYNSSTEVPDTKNLNIKKFGRVVDTYSLFGNNCTTTSCDALKYAGTDIFNVDGLFYDYDEDFTIPSSLQDFLLEKSKVKNSKVKDITNAMKQQFPNDMNKGILKSAGSSGETSGASGSSAGSSANSSSANASSSGNGSGSSGSGSGSSSS